MLNSGAAAADDEDDDYDEKTAKDILIIMICIDHIYLIVYTMGTNRLSLIIISSYSHTAHTHRLSLYYIHPINNNNKEQILPKNHRTEEHTEDNKEERVIAWMDVSLIRMRFSL